MTLLAFAYEIAKNNGPVPYNVFSHYLIHSFFFLHLCSLDTLHFSTSPLPAGKRNKSILPNFQSMICSFILFYFKITNERLFTALFLSLQRYFRFWFIYLFASIYLYIESDAHETDFDNVILLISSKRYSNLKAATYNPSVLMGALHVLPHPIGALVFTH